jgi:LPXTG-motif cell wall-anchored protein
MVLVVLVWGTTLPDTGESDTVWDIALGIVLILVTASFLAKVVLRLFTKTRFFSDTNLRQEISACVNEARDWLLVVTPYIDPGNLMVEEIAQAASRGVRTKLFIHSKQIHDPSAQAAIGRLGGSGVEIYHHPNLHAKLYLSECVAVVSSLNLVAGSFIDSFEAGVVSNDREIRQKARKYIEDTIAKSSLCSAIEKTDLAPAHGYCIRTKVKIKFDPRKPVEFGEYKRSGASNIGKYCHACGEMHPTSIGMPFCEDHESYAS